MDPDEIPILEVEALGKLEAVGGPSLVVRMIDLFTKLVPERLVAARGALDEGDIGTVERYMHSMKSSAANMGAQRLRRHATTAEKLAAEFEGDGAAMRRAIDELERDYQELEALLTAERARRETAS